MECPKCKGEIKLPKDEMIKLYLNKNRKISAHCKECDEKFTTKIFVDVQFYIEDYDIECDYEEIEDVEGYIQETKEEIREEK